MNRIDNIADWPVQPLLGTGRVLHTRLRPNRHTFSYSAYFVWLPLRTLRRQPELLTQAGLNRNWLKFDPADHGAHRPQLNELLSWMDDLLKQQGINDADGELWLQCFPKVLGYAFKPVSFWHALRADGSLRATVAEVNNTFGEHHCYVLDHPDWGRTQWADKVFHVSPFCTVSGRYAFRFTCGSDAAASASTPRCAARIDYADDAGPILSTHIGGHLQRATPAGLRRAFWTHPAQSWAITARIHWQALRLWLKGVPFHAKPTPPAIPVTVSSLASPQQPAARP